MERRVGGSSGYLVRVKDFDSVLREVFVEWRFFN